MNSFMAIFSWGIDNIELIMNGLEGDLTIDDVGSDE